MWLRIGITAFAVAAGAGSALAQPLNATPVAIVEDIKGAPAGVEFMDYVAPGKVIKLGATGQIVLGYLKSCLREVIGGGTVTVGMDQSVVDGGTAERTKVACEAGKMQLTAELASKSGAMAFRDMPRAGKPSPTQLRPQFTLYGASPMVELHKGTTVVIERLDQPGERYELMGDSLPLVHGAFYDFAANGKALVKAGVYRASLDKVQVLFQIDPSAEPGRTPVAGRLLRLQPAS